METLVLTPGQVELADLRRIAETRIQIAIPDESWQAVEDSAQTVERIVAQGKPAYGINTGFGKLANIQIPDDELAQLQTNLVRSHAAGVGDLLDERAVRLISVLKILSLAQGMSGVRPESLRVAIEAFNAGILPCIPEQGSVGASGDLAPLAHYTLTLIGEGEALYQGKRLPSADALRRAGITPIQLGAKEGLAFLNGTQVSTALALLGLFEIERVFGAAVLAAAMSLDATRGSDSPFDPRIHRARGHLGQQQVAALLLTLLEGSEIRASHLENDDRVQDPYSIRCTPQVLGACLDQIRFQAGILLDESNGVTDNPLVFDREPNIVSGGNFHAEPVALAADVLAIAAAEIASVSERRTALLTDPNLSRLPAFLTAHPGLNSGFMIAHVTAAALVSENKTLCHPASVDSLPTSANQEDHVSMATFAGTKLRRVARNARYVIAIELLAAAQGVDFHRPLQSGPTIDELHAEIRARVPHYGEDRIFTPDIEAVSAMIEEDDLFAAALRLTPSHEGEWFAD